MILIKNVKIIDGTGRKAYGADVLVKDDKIIEIGKFNSKNIKVVIDGNNGYLTPSFFDFFSLADKFDFDLNFSWMDNFLKNGVGNVTLGQNGYSLAPIHSLNDVNNFYLWGKFKKSSFSWGGVDEFNNFLKNKDLQCKCVNFLGLNNLRRHVLNNKRRDMREVELGVLLQEIEKFLDKGFYGVSIDFNDIYGRGWNNFEIREIVDVVKNRKKILSLNLKRGYQNNLYNLIEIINIAKESKVKLVVNQVSEMILGRDFYLEVVEFFKKNVKLNNVFFSGGVNVEFVNLIDLFTVFWNYDNYLEIINSLNNEIVVKEVLKDFERMNDFNVFVSHDHSGLDFDGIILNKKNLINILKKTSLKVVVGVTKKNKSEVDYDVLNLKNFIPNFQDMSFNKESFFISEFNKVEMEKIIYKISGFLAYFFEIEKRGVIHKGNFADMNLIVNNKIKMVMMNGVVKYFEGKKI